MMTMMMATTTTTMMVVVVVVMMMMKMALKQCVENTFRMTTFETRIILDIIVQNAKFRCMGKAVGGTGLLVTCVTFALDTLTS